MAGKGKKLKMVCLQCKRNIKEETDYFIECNKCAKNCHLQCTELSKTDFEYLIKKREKCLFITHAKEKKKY